MTQTLVTNSYVQGTAITFAISEPFTAADGVTIVDPDVVLFGFQVDGITSQTHTFTYTYGTGDPTGTIVRLGLGTYQAVIDTSSYPTGVWVYSIAGEPKSIVNHDATKTKIRVENQVIVTPASFSMG
jgi:hypothetical protein